jgi:hypothetical protein
MVYSYTGIDAYLVCGFLVCYMYAPSFGGTMNLCNSTLSSTDLALIWKYDLFECPCNNNPFVSPIIYFYRLFPVVIFLFSPKFAVLYNFIHIQFSYGSFINFIFPSGSRFIFASLLKYCFHFSFMTMRSYHLANIFSL